MTAKYFAILTNQGAARLANAAALGTQLNLTHMAVGDANGALPTPDPAQTKLINQRRIKPLNLLTVDPNNTSQIIAEQIIPENEGGFWIREIGLYDDDGILIAVANCPETYKPQLQEGSGRTQTIRMILIVSSTSAITLKIDPSVVLATRQYVDDKVVEVKSYTDNQISEHEKSRNHPDASTTEKGFVQLSSSVTSDSETQAVTSKAVKIAMDNANVRLAKERNLADLPNQVLARKNLGFDDLGFGISNVVNKTIIDWQQFEFINGASYRTIFGDWVNPPPDMTFTTATINVQIFVVGISGTSVVLEVSPYSVADSNYCYFVYLNGAKGSRIFKSRQYFTSSTIVQIENGGTGAQTVSGALQNLGLGEGSALPVGVPVPWPSSIPPTGWLKCNGAAFSASQYPKLALAYPTLRLPDLRGEFIRGCDDGRGIDASRSLLSLQLDAFQGHNRDLRRNGGGTDNIHGVVTVTRGVDFSVPMGISNGDTWLTANYMASEYGDPRVARETRPRNIAFNYIVRAA